MATVVAAPPKAGVYDLRPWQIRAASKGMERNILVWHDRGLGKTVTGTVIADQVSRHSRASKLNLIVCKKGAREQWRRTIRAAVPDAVVEVWNDPGEVRKLDRTKPTWIVVHYDVFRRLSGNFKLYLWATVVLDECHRIRNRKTQLSAAIKDVQTIRKVAMSGTVMHKHGAELWSILNWLYPEKYRGYWDFHKKYVEEKLLRNRKTGTEYRKIVGTKPEMREALATELAPFTDYETKATADPDLPRKVYEPVHIELEERQQKLYNRIKKAKDIELDLGEFEAGAFRLLTSQLQRVLLLQQAAGWPALVGVPSVPSAKLEWLDEYIADNPDDTIIIATKFRSTALHIAQKLNAVLIMGGAWKSQYKSPPLTDFEQGKVRYVVGTIAAINDSYDWGFADTLIAFDVDHSSIIMSQLEDRHHRMTALKSKLIIYLLGAKTIDEMIYEAVQGRWTEQEFIARAVQAGYL